MRRPTRFVCFWLLALGSCADPPRPVKAEDVGAHVRRVATVWWENSVESGALQGDPNGVTGYRTEIEIRVELGEDGSARERVLRKEGFRMADGGAFRCSTAGAAGGRATYAREAGEPRVTIRRDAATLERTCDRPGFPVLSKELPESTVVYVLRGDRLVAVDPPRVRRVLLPGH